MDTVRVFLLFLTAFAQLARGNTVVDHEYRVEPVRWNPSQRVARRAHIGIVSPVDGTVVCSGHLFSCAIDSGAEAGAATHAGAVRCWGHTSAHGLGRVPEGRFVQVGCGEAFACALREDHSASCWGAVSGALGSAEVSVVQISVGRTVACGLTDTGEIVCLGKDRTNQVGGIPRKTRFLQVSVGGGHTCGITRKNTVRCWGRAQSGETDAPRGVQFRQVSAGIGPHSCGVTSEGDLLCWGANAHGEALPPFLAAAAGVSLGDEDATDDVDDWAVTPSFKQVAAGKHVTCGVTTHEELVCFGRPNSAQLLDPPAGAFEHVSVHDSHACAVRAGGVSPRVVCFGDDHVGQLAVPPGLNPPASE